MTSEVKHLRGRLGVFGASVFVALGTDVALACPICFRVEEGATTDGVRAAVLVLIGVTAVLLGAFARFIVGFVARESHEVAVRQGHREGTVRAGSD